MSTDERKVRSLDRLADYSDESLIREVRRIAEVVGHARLTMRDIETYGRCSYAVLKKRFGGLHNLLSQAGLCKYEFHRNISDHELLRELSRIWDVVLTHEGRRPHRDDMKKYGACFSYGSYNRRWGSWVKACEAVLAMGSGEADSIESSEKDVAGTVRQPHHKKKSIPLRIRYAILLRDRFTCRTCGRSPSNMPGLEIDVDHIVPESKGGTLDPTNLRCLCKECNVGKGNIG